MFYRFFLPRHNNMENITVIGQIISYILSSSSVSSYPQFFYYNLTKAIKVSI